MQIKKNHLYFIILLIPYIEPQLFKASGFELMDKIFLILKLISAIFIILEYILKINVRISKYVLLMIGVQMIIFISTFLNNGSITRFLGPAITAVVMIMYGEMVFLYDWKKILLYIENYISILVGINLFTFILQLMGLYPFEFTFLGMDNRWIYTFLPWTIIAFINSYFKTGKINSHAWVIYSISTISLLVMWSVGALLSFIIIPFVFIFTHNNIEGKKYKRFGFISRLTYIITLYINYILVNGEILKIFSRIIQKYLKKDITLSGRTHLWNAVIDVLNKKPFFGMGVQSNISDGEFFYKASGYIPGMKLNHPHNNLLNIAFHGGWLALGLFIIIVYFVMKDIDHIKDSYLYRIMLAGTIAIFTAALVDTLDFSLFYLLIPIVSCIRKNAQNNIDKQWLLRQVTNN